MAQFFEARDIISAPLDVEALHYQIHRLALALLVNGYGTLRCPGELWEEARLSMVEFLEGRAAPLLSSVCAVRIQVNKGRLDVIVSSMDGFYTEMEIWSLLFNYGDPVEDASRRREILQPAAGAIIASYHLEKAKLYRYMFVGEGSTTQRLRAFPRTELLKDMVELGQWITVILGPRDISIQPYVSTHDRGSWRFGHLRDGVKPTPTKKATHLKVVK